MSIPFIVENPPAPEALTAEIERLAADHPNAHYQAPGAYDEGLVSSCRYLSGEAGPGQGCLFGQALINLGFPRTVLGEADKYGTSILGLSESWGVDVGIRRRWRAVQALQDMGSAWGVAIKALQY